MSSVMGTPSVSILLPLFNGELYLREQVSSILNQRGVRVRLFIIDDKSVDGSLTLARELAAVDKRITVLENQENVGLIRTLDRLLSLVETDYFALSDQDDVWDNNKLLESVDALESFGHVLVYSDVRLIDEFARLQIHSYLVSRRIRPIEGRDPVPFIFRNPAVGHTMVGRRAVTERARPMPCDLVFHEAWLVAVACSIGSVGFVRSGPLGSYRVHATNVVGPADARVRQKFLAVIRSGSWMSHRAETRAAALRAAAQVDPTLATAALDYASRGLSRLWHVPRFARFQWTRNRQSGLRSVIVEVIAFTVASAKADGCSA